jgi:hypothetical protein
VKKLGPILKSGSIEADLAKTATDIREGKIEVKIDINKTDPSTIQPDSSKSQNED